MPSYVPQNSKWLCIMLNLDGFVFISWMYIGVIYWLLKGTGRSVWAQPRKWCNISCQRMKFYISNGILSQTNFALFNMNVSPSFPFRSIQSRFLFNIKKHYHRNLHPVQLFTGWLSVIVMLGWFTSSSAIKFDCFSCVNQVMN